MDRVMNPKVRVGTIHASKGDEAHNVVLLTTSTYLCNAVQEANEEGRNAERRLSYVGVTRALSHLYVLRSRNAQYEVPVH